MHDYYTQIIDKKDISIVLDPNDIRIECMPESELKSQLKFHKVMYADVFLNEGNDSLRKKLIFILRIRKKEEIMFNYCCFNK